MSAAALTRAEAHALIDRAEMEGALQGLAAHWNICGSWNDSVSPEQWRMALQEHVECCALSDDSRSRGPQDGDDTGLEDMP